MFPEENMPQPVDGICGHPKPISSIYSGV